MLFDLFMILKVYLVYVFNNSTETLHIPHKFHQVNLHYSVVFSIYIELSNHHQKLILELFISQKDTLHMCSSRSRPSSNLCIVKCFIFLYALYPRPSK